MLAVGVLACAGTVRETDGEATPLAYEVRGPGAGRALLFGSVHVGRADEWILPEWLRTEMEQAELLVLEIDLSATGPEEMLQLMLALGVMPPGQRLRQVVSDPTWALLEQRARETGTPIEAFDHLKPWVVALQFIGLSLDRAGFQPEQGVELGLVAGSPTLPIRGLETPYEQLSSFDDLPFPVQDRMLFEALQPAAEKDSELEALIDAWRRGDANRIEAIIFRDRQDPKLARFYEQTYDRRNARMAEGIEEILAEPVRAFVVVGAGHLVGPRSIPILLRESGLRVRQVSGQP